MGRSRRLGLSVLLVAMLVVGLPGVAGAWHDGTDPDECYGYETWPADVDGGAGGSGGSGGTVGEGEYVEGSEGGSGVDGEYGSPDYDGDDTVTDGPEDGTDYGSVPDDGTDGGGVDEAHCYGSGGSGAGGGDTGAEGGEPTSGPVEESTESAGGGGGEGVGDDDHAFDGCGSDGDMPADTMPADSVDGDEPVSSSAVGEIYCVPSVYESAPQPGRPVGGVGAAGGVRDLGGAVAAIPTRIDAGAGALASTGAAALQMIAGAGALLAAGGALVAGAGAGLRRRRRR